MKNFGSKNILISVCLGAFSAIFFLLFFKIFKIYSLWILDKLGTEAVNFKIWHYISFFVFAIAAAVAVERYKTKKVIIGSAIFFAFWVVSAILSIIYFRVNIGFFGVVLAVSLSVLLAHLQKLWKIDYQLTEKIIRLTSIGHYFHTESAESRIERSLKLLETVLPLSEAIVFRIENQTINPVGRSRLKKKADTFSERQYSWQETVGLCLQAAEKREIQMRCNEAEGEAHIALPLMYEAQPVGVLFVEMQQNFEREDKFLLEAFSEQLARNFLRKELRVKELPNKSWLGFVSTGATENRVEMITLINTLIKEQTFTKLAGSYLQEAHAVAYLDGTISYMNRQMRSLANITPDDVYQLDIFRLLDKFKTDVFNEPGLAIRRVLQTGNKFAGELYFPETNKTLDLRISLVKVPQEEQSIFQTDISLVPACFMISVRDISAVKENEKLRSDMASLMSHELRTPITSIKGFAELMLADENFPADSREFLQIIANESERLSKMLSTFLSVSNLEQNDKNEVVKTPVKLDNVIHEVVESLSEKAKSKRIRLVERRNSFLPPVAADRSLITAAVGNLIDNAIKYSPERTSVIVSTLLEAEVLRVVVEDGGYGIPFGDFDKIWQKFYRVEREGFDKEENSTGLGLSFVKEAVEQHGGEVSVESEINLGSKFSFTLPRL